MKALYFLDNFLLTSCSCSTSSSHHGHSVNTARLSSVNIEASPEMRWLCLNLDSLANFKEPEKRLYSEGPVLKPTLWFDGFQEVSLLGFVRILQKFFTCSLLEKK
ncbi:ANM_HP_G0247980.mRNA.1.CDS.1 [Saccharomyces cerevisiae]|nr:ANM_HP_G0247980.mRNA.1.CDS.1 [Saccharomyces cerevisiae]CAI7005582.1 ANM_HP_G0247980.mRNA.1.CDS.1 [Saccharomyces cerevisiae]